MSIAFGCLRIGTALISLIAAACSTAGVGLASDEMDEVLERLAKQQVEIRAQLLPAPSANDAPIAAAGAYF